MRILIAVILLLIVGCTGVVHANQQATEDEDRIAHLGERVSQLEEEAIVHEEHIRALQWTDEAWVIQVVQNRMLERTIDCYVYRCFSQDWVLAAWWHQIAPLPVRYWDTAINRVTRDTIVPLAANDEYWSAEQLNETDWVVTAQLGDTAYQFIAESTYNHTICWTGLDWCTWSPPAQ